jgi:hypothetical protein
MKDLYTEICDLSHQALENGTSADELVVILLSHALISAKHLRLSKTFCIDEFDSAIEDIYGEEAEEEQEKQKCCNCSCTRTEIDESVSEKLKEFLQGFAYKPTCGG